MGKGRTITWSMQQKNTNSAGELNRSLELENQIGSVYFTENIVTFP